MHDWKAVNVKHVLHQNVSVTHYQQSAISLSSLNNISITNIDKAFYTLFEVALLVVNPLCGNFTPLVAFAHCSGFRTKLGQSDIFFKSFILTSKCFYAVLMAQICQQNTFRVSPTLKTIGESPF